MAEEDTQGMAELLEEEQSLKSLRRGDIIEGLVMHADRESILVDISSKTEGVIPAQEMYGEMFDIPAPDELVFVSSFAGGEVFRSGAAFRRGKGKIFYFRPGHETFPIYHNPNVQSFFQLIHLRVFVLQRLVRVRALIDCVLASSSSSSTSNR